MKLSDYVIDFLVKRGVTHVFGMSGGAAVHLFDSADRHPGMTPIFSQHEQSAAMSADGYSRATGKLGVAITTSGPGATNLLTGVACSYYDSVPTMMITGQVATYRLKGDRPIRQMGFQETDVLSVFSSLTKYAAQISDPQTIRFHLEKACHLAFEGRPGPVLIDIPDDLQRAEVEHDKMRGFVPELPAPADAGDMDKLMALLSRAKRPALILGGGLLTPRIADIMALVDRLKIPVLQTWAALDLVPYEHPLRVGPFGVYGPRLGNFTVQNADFLLCLGSRLSQNVTGGILPAFAREATLVMVDASAGEMDKFDGRGIDVSLRINRRLDGFVPALLKRLAGAELPNIDPWLAKIAHWRTHLPADLPAPAKDDAGFVDAYDFVAALSGVLPAGETIIADTGGNLTWTCNQLRAKPDQKLLSAWNYTPMGYALPAAIGAVMADRSRRITCIIGDGGLMLCLGELATLRRHKLPITVLLFNNHGHGIQKQTLETWLDAHNVGVDEPSGLSFADFPKLGEAVGLPTVTVAKSSGMKRQLEEVYAMTGPVFCNVEIRPEQKLHPVLKFGAPLEDQMPSMGVDAIRAEMLIPEFNPKAGAPKVAASTGV